VPLHSLSTLERERERESIATEDLTVCRRVVLIGG